MANNEVQEKKKRRGPSKVEKPAKTRKAPRTAHQEMEAREKSYIAASTRHDRKDNLEGRFKSAMLASELHKQRTGRALKVTREIVASNPDFYEEEASPMLDLRKNHNLFTSMYNQAPVPNTHEALIQHLRDNPELTKSLEALLAVARGQDNVEPADPIMVREMSQFVQIKQQDMTNRLNQPSFNQQDDIAGPGQTMAGNNNNHWIPPQKRMRTDSTSPQEMNNSLNQPYFNQQADLAGPGQTMAENNNNHWTSPSKRLRTESMISFGMMSQDMPPTPATTSRGSSSQSLGSTPSSMQSHMPSYQQNMTPPPMSLNANLPTDMATSMDRSPSNESNQSIQSNQIHQGYQGYQSHQSNAYNFSPNALENYTFQSPTLQSSFHQTASTPHTGQVHQEPSIYPVPRTFGFNQQNEIQDQDFDAQSNMQDDDAAFIDYNGGLGDIDFSSVSEMV